MRGEVARFIRTAVAGRDPAAQARLMEVFGDDFQTVNGWLAMLANLGAFNVMEALDRPAGSWTREKFQAVYVSCWIHHPLEKGSYMLKLSDGNPPAVQAYQALLGTGDLQRRISSHLSGQGASAHEGWAFLRGYGELLLQIEQQGGSNYLFLKCEGHPMTGIGETVLHGFSYAVKTLTGRGATANKELKRWAKDDGVMVEPRAAENFSGAYPDLLKRLQLTDRNTTVRDVIQGLCAKANVPFNNENDTQALAKAMMTGYIQTFATRRVISGKEAYELSEIAMRMMHAGQTHSEQIYQEIRVAPWEVDQSLDRFLKIISGG